MMKKIKKSNAGFTLVELIVVIAILGVLMAALVPQYVKYIEKSREGVDLATLGEILHAAKIVAAEGDDTVTSFDVVFKGGVLTIDSKLTSIIPSASLKSTDGKAIVGTATISISNTGEIGWGTGHLDTDAAFPGLEDGTKGGSTPYAVGIVTTTPVG